MTRRRDDLPDDRLPPLWRLLLVALCTLILCSCQAPQPAGWAGGNRAAFPSPTAPLPSPALVPPGTLPQTAFTGEPAMPVECPEGVPVLAPGPMPPAMAMAPGPVGPWTPPGLSQPWPPDEYLADGGDLEPHAAVGGQWEVRGLNLEDTIAHFDTVEGRTVVVPSNRVFVYSPRFGAVRQVVSLRGNEQLDRWGGVYLPTTLVQNEERQSAGTDTQNYQAQASVGRRVPSTYLARQGDGVMSSAVGPRGFHDTFKAYENLSIIRQGIFEGAEMAWLAQGTQAAVTWSHDQAVQVILDEVKATEAVSDEQAMSVFSINAPPGNPRLRVIKVASAQEAQPGDTVDFTIRFDNVGNQVIGNVTIIDNLTTRLEYVPDSAQCSLDAQFLTQPNEGQSLVLRWEIAKPIKPGDGGIIRFACRVR